MLPSDVDSDDQDDELKFKDDDDFQRVEPLRQAADFFAGQPRIESQVATVEPPPPPPRHLFLTGILTFPFYPGTMVTYTYLTLGLALATFLVIILYYIMTVAFTMGPIIGVPVGLLTMVVVSYASIVYVHVIEQTAEGYDAIEDWPAGGWREWFWSLPLTAGAVAIVGIAGWIISSVFFAGTWQPLAITVVLLYPLVQLLVLDSGNPLRPFSKRVLRSVKEHPAEWLTFYTETMLVVGLFVLVFALAYRWSPYLGPIVMAPIAAAMLLVYARLMGRIAGLFGSED